MAQMKPNISIREVARLAGVSPSTVSRILNDHEERIPFAAKTRKRIHALCKQVGYEPNIHAKRLFTGRSDVLALVVPPPSDRVTQSIRQQDMHYTATLSGIEDQASELGQDLLLVTQNKRFLDNKKYRSLFTSQSIDGMLIWGATWDDGYIQEIVDQEFPVVLVGTRLHNPAIPHVGVDHIQAGRLMASHLLEMGHRHFAYLSGPLTASIMQDRHDGLVKTCQDHGAKVSVFHGDFSDASGYALTQQILNQKDHPTVIVAVNDMIAIGALEAAQKQGLRIPQDLSIACLEQQVPLYKPQLTSLEMPVYEVGQRGVQYLMQIIDSYHRQETRTKLSPPALLSAQLIQGQTASPVCSGSGKSS